MRSKLPLSVICLFMLSLQLFAQRTVTNRLCVSCIPYEQYQVNAQGNRHGYYKTWSKQGKLIHESNWSNGVEHGRNIDYDSATGAIQRDAMMHNGQMTSLKVFSYNLEGTKRSLVREGTWLNDGTILTSREFDPVHNKWIESAGKLSNGRFWYDKYGYNEKYNANDTVYVWLSKDKEIFEGKLIGDIFIKSGQRIQEQIAYEEAIRQDSILAVKAKVLNDSIYEANKIIHKENAAMIPTIAKQYDRFIADSLEISESELYHFIVDYYVTGSDTTLKSMILYAMNIEVNADFDLAKLILTATDFTNYNTTKTVIYAYYDEGESELNYPYTELKSCVHANHKYITYGNINNSLDLYNEAVSIATSQLTLMDIVKYCKHNNISYSK